MKKKAPPTYQKGPVMSSADICYYYHDPDIRNQTWIRTSDAVTKKEFDRVKDQIKKLEDIIKLRGGIQE